MQKRSYTKTFIRQWREYRGLSLRQLAQRLELEGSQETYSHASISRIEKGEQPYSQPILEAIAQALSVDVVDLLTVDPSKEGEVVDLLALLRKANPDQQKLVRDLAERVLKTG